MPRKISRATVPDLWKYPNGPYRQAPPEWGGEWWYVSPFTGSEPWTRYGQPVQEEQFPPGAIDVYGPKPNEQFARQIWLDNVRAFEPAQFPEALAPWVPDAERTFQAWGVGRMVPFNDKRFGLMVAFPESGVVGHSDSMYHAVTATHQEIAEYQVKYLEAGNEIPRSRLHPFFPYSRIREFFPSEDEA